MIKKISITLFVIISVFFVFADCESENIDNEQVIDPILWEWELESFDNNGTTFHPEEWDNLIPDAYKLIFLSDSSFRLRTSVNEAGGSYTILDTHKIVIYSYHEFTEVGQGRDNIRRLDDNLIVVFKESDYYQASETKLTFKGTMGNVIFRKGEIYEPMK